MNNINQLPKPRDNNKRASNRRTKDIPVLLLSLIQNK